VDALPAESTHRIEVSWTGDDEAGAGSGVGRYDVYVSDDGGPFELWLDATEKTSDVFDGDVGHTYAFYSVATDNVGHREAAPAAADTQTLVTRVLWQNPDNRFDVDGDGGVFPLDVLLLINYINAHPGDSSLPPPPEMPPLYYDVDDDQACTAADVLHVVNDINRRSGGGEGELQSQPLGQPALVAESPPLDVITQGVFTRRVEGDDEGAYSDRAYTDRGGLPAYTRENDRWVIAVVDDEETEEEPPVDEEESVFDDTLGLSLDVILPDIVRAIDLAWRLP
jgi:hypothetical protein